MTHAPESAAICTAGAGRTGTPIDIGAAAGGSERPSDINERLARAAAKFDDLRVDYEPQAVAVAALDRVRLAAKFRTPGRPCAGAMLVAPFGTGKTCTIEMLVEHAQRGAEPDTVPVLAVQTSTLGSTDSVPTSILYALNVPKPEVGNEKSRWLRAVSELRRVRVELVMFDEFDRAHRRPTMSAPIVRSIREHIMDKSVAAVGFVGCEDASKVLKLCPETIQRLDDEIDLMPLDWIDPADQEILVDFLDNVDAALVEHELLRARSLLCDAGTAEKLCEATNGSVRSIMKVIRHAMMTALERGALAIEKPDLFDGVDLHCVRKGFCPINPFA